MKTAGIIAEYNPFHRGHAYQIEMTREKLGGDCAVVCVMSGNWVQQAGCAVADKWTRARLALMGGADLVLELPTPWATASAERFARGGVSLLAASGVVDAISFGSEAGETDLLRAAARCLDTLDYSRELQRLLGTGLPYAAARQQAAEACIGPAAACLARPNNNLGVEYLRAMEHLGGEWDVITVPRRGSEHGGDAFERGFASATQIRRMLSEGDRQGAEGNLLPGALPLLEQAGVADLRRCERAVLARLRTMTAEDWAALPDSGAQEGLPERMERAARQAVRLEEFYDLAKTRRYTHARIRRLVLRAFLGIGENSVPEMPCYLRVLGFNPRGRELLREMKTRSTLPILTKSAHARALDGVGRALFELEARCTDLYTLCLPEIGKPGQEWTRNPVILE